MSTLTVINKVAIVKTGRDITIIAMKIFTYAVYVWFGYNTALNTLIHTQKQNSYSMFFQQSI